jgi:hypothetical protein
MNLRQIKRRLLFQNHFETMPFNLPHVYIDRRTKTRIEIDKRSDRRKLARALAARDWRSESPETRGIGK